ncbi:MAG: hypothetical protein EZS28_049062, partial [Streblomastix strix]
YSRVQFGKLDQKAGWPAELSAGGTSKLDYQVYCSPKVGGLKVRSTRTDLALTQGKKQINKDLKLEVALEGAYEIRNNKVIRAVEQIEEQGANEEIEAKMSNTKYNGHIKSWTNEAKAAQLNRFIHDY